MSDNFVTKAAKSETLTGVSRILTIVMSLLAPGLGYILVDLYTVFGHINEHLANDDTRLVTIETDRAIRIQEASIRNNAIDLRLTKFEEDVGGLKSELTRASTKLDDLIQAISTRNVLPTNQR